MAGIIEFPEKSKKPNLVFLKKGFVLSSNQRMELMACIEALEYLIRHKNLNTKRAIIVTDSKYVNDNKNRCFYWKNDGWVNSAGRPIENKDLWNKFIQLKQKLRVYCEISWSKGKTTEILKEVDRLAKEYAKYSPVNIDRGFSSGKLFSAQSSGRNFMFEANNQEILIKVTKYSQKKDKDGKVTKVYFSEYLVEEGAYKGKYYAYTRATLDMIHRGRYYFKVKFNNNKEYPMFEIVEEFKRT